MIVFLPFPEWLIFIINLCKKKKKSEFYSFTVLHIIVHTILSVTLFTFSLPVVSVGMSFSLLENIKLRSFPVIYAWNVSCEIILKVYYLFLQISSQDSFLCDKHKKRLNWADEHWRHIGSFLSFCFLVPFFFFSILCIVFYNGYWPESKKYNLSTIVNKYQFSWK